ncbi:hypothetical protein [Streptomyces nitrosporeus]|uniref:hypothetical protein n=1 Tax=Streptomyces nitrosporeus TaxID=28894 RepID=UPI003319C060
MTPQHTNDDSRLPVRWAVILLAAAPVGGVTGAGAGMMADAAYGPAIGLMVGTATGIAAFIATMNRLHRMLGHD